MHQPLMHLVFYLDIRRSGIGSPPLFDIRQDLCTHLPQGLFIHRFSAPFFCFRMALSYHLLSDWTSHLQKFMGHPLYGTMLAGNLSQRFLPLCLTKAEEDACEPFLSLDAEHDQ